MSFSEGIGASLRFHARGRPISHWRLYPGPFLPALAELRAVQEPATRVASHHRLGGESWATFLQPKATSSPYTRPSTGCSRKTSSFNWWGTIQRRRLHTACRSPVRESCETSSKVKKYCIRY